MEEKDLNGGLGLWAEIPPEMGAEREGFGDDEEDDDRASIIFRLACWALTIGLLPEMPPDERRGAPRGGEVPGAGLAGGDDMVWLGWWRGKGRGLEGWSYSSRVTV
jgi:hypothetical protein